MIIILLVYSEDSSSIIWSLIHKNCTFEVKSDKFLGFYLTERGIEANRDKCETLIWMVEPTIKKEVEVERDANNLK